MNSYIAFITDDAVETLMVLVSFGETLYFCQRDERCGGVFLLVHGNDIIWHEDNFAAKWAYHHTHAIVLSILII